MGHYCREGGRKTKKSRRPNLNCYMYSRRAPWSKTHLSLATNGGRDKRESEDAATYLTVSLVGAILVENEWPSRRPSDRTAETDEAKSSLPA